jgi:hypothetical protein
MMDLLNVVLPLHAENFMVKNPELFHLVMVINAITKNSG